MRDYKFKDKVRYVEVDSLDDIQMGPNYVLIKTLLDTSETAGGILIDKSWREIDGAERICEVIKVPPFLVINGETYGNEFHDALNWQTTMELQVGDIAWVEPLHVVMNSDTMLTNMAFKVGDQLYFRIRYDKFIVAKRGDKVIPLNGYILIEEKWEDVGFGDFENIQPTGICEVRYVGSRNGNYYARNYDDSIPVEVGDIVGAPKHKFYLEDETYACFEGDKRMIYVQRNRLTYSHKKDTMDYKEFNWAPGKVYLEKKDEEEKTSNGLIVPESQRKSKNRGLVVAMGAKRVKDEELVGLGLGSTIYYNTAKPITVEGIEFLEVDVMNIHTWKPSK